MVLRFGKYLVHSEEHEQLSQIKLLRSYVDPIFQELQALIRHFAAPWLERIRPRSGSARSRWFASALAGASAVSGLYYDELHVGQVFAHAITRTVTETDNLLFTALTHNPQPLHLDVEFTKSTEFGQRLVNS